MRGEDVLVIYVTKREGGITPACAGKTRAADVVCMGLKDHPRMRGEDCLILQWNQFKGGSPPHARGRLIKAMNPGNIKRITPHARGRPAVYVRATFVDRITPACAGKTVIGNNLLKSLQDHPRMRGEDPAVGESVVHGIGITPACAGKT